MRLQDSGIVIMSRIDAVGSNEKMKMARGGAGLKKQIDRRELEVLLLE